MTDQENDKNQGQTDPDLHGLLKANDVAASLNVGKSMAYKLLQLGKIPRVRVGYAIRVRPEDLERYIKINLENLKEIDLSEVDRLPHQGIRKTKETRCKTFLRVLFYARSEGLPMTKVIEIAKEHGFGLRLTKKIASEMSINKHRITINGTSTVMWVPSDANFITSLFYSN